MDCLVSVHGLSKEYSGHKVVDCVSFSVRAGRITGFLGPNGAGKTTTLRTMLELYQPTSGATKFLGDRYTSLRSEARSVGVVLGSSFHPGMKVSAQLRISAAAIRVGVSEVSRVAAVTGVSEFMNKRCGQLSLGMKQRLSLAQALLGNPRILILDEPTNGLDPQGIAWLRNFLRSQADQGKAILISSHQLAESEYMVDDVVVIDRGQVVHASSLQQWKAVSPKVIRVNSNDAVALDQVLSSRGGVCTYLPGNILLVQGLSSSEIEVSASESDISLNSCAEVEPSLEQLFFATTAEGAATHGDYILATKIEFMKFYSVRLWWILTVISILFVGAVSSLVASSIAPADDAPLSVFGYAYIVAGRAAYIFPLLAGTILVTSEFRYGTLTQSVLSGLGRPAILVGKLLCGAVYALLLGVLTAAVNAASVVLQFKLAGKGSMLNELDNLFVLLRTPLAFCMWAFIGVGFGYLLKNQVAAILSVVGFTLIVEPILTSVAGEQTWFAGVGKFLPGAASLSLVWPPDPALEGVLVSLSATGGGLVLFGWALLILCIAALKFSRQDIHE